MFNKDKFNEMPKSSDMRFQYAYDFKNRAWAVYEDGGHIASIDATDEDKFLGTSGVVTLDIDILQDFKIFKQRPEYYLMHFEIPQEVAKFVDVYETLFAGAIFIRARNHNVGCNPDDAWPQIEKALNWLRTNDFYKAPASSRFHDAFEGGLCFHSLKVVQNIIDLMHCSKFADSSKLGDAVFCALVHDWCKINLYEQYQKNVKNDETGLWEKVAAYRYTGNAILNLGHGVSSMFVVSKFFKLNVEEASAIRWHMGSYRVVESEFSELQTCNEQFPLVHLLQFADQLSLVNY